MVQTNKLTMTARLRRMVMAAATLATISIACGGCAYVMPSTSLDREPDAKWYAKDVPVPENFKYQQKLSLSAERNGTRNLRLVYKRDSYIDIERTWDFYEAHLTGRGWQLRYLYGFDRRGMIFWKGDEELRVTLDRSLPEAYVIATIEIEPRDSTAAIPVVARRSP